MGVIYPVLHKHAKDWISVASFKFCFWISVDFPRLELESAG